MCSAGYRAETWEGGRQCVSCKLEVGTYSADGLLCVPCGAGREPAADGRSCVECTKGYFSPESSRWSSVCVLTMILCDVTIICA